MARATKKRRTSNKKFRWTKELIFLIIFLCVIGLATGLMSIESKSTKLYNEITEAQQSNSITTYMSEDNVFEKISYKKILNKITSDDYTFVYYGTSSNSDFLTYIQTVNERAKEYEVSKVWILDSSLYTDLDLDDEDEGEANNQKLVDRENSLDGVDLSVYPNLFVFKGGKLVYQLSDYTKDSYTEMNMNLAIEQAFGKTVGKDSKSE